jgi:hypothetical protein
MISNKYKNNLNLDGKGPKIILLLEDINNFKSLNLKNFSKLYKNIYIFILYCFKFLIFKNFLNINFFFISYFYQKYLYFNINESRFYYLLYYLLLNNNLYYFIELIFSFILKLEANKFTFDYFSLPIVRKKLEWWEEDTFIEIFFFKRYYIFFYNNKIYIYLYLLLKINFILFFNKLNFYNYLNLLKNIFFFNEFIIKIEYKSFFLYKNYIEYFRLVKYNEYLSNNKILWNYPFLRVLYRINIECLKVRILYKKGLILSKSHNIYILNKNYGNFFNKYINYSLININNLDLNENFYDINLRTIRQNNQQGSLNLIKGFSFFNYDNFRINNEYINFKINNFDILYFIKFLNPIFFFRIFKILKLILFIYVSFYTYEIYHKYISLVKLLRKISWKHLLSLFW